MKKAKGKSNNKERRFLLSAYGSLLLISCFFTSVSGQTIPADREALESGAGAGMASYADPNGYPGPKHILELQDTLQLSDDQVKEVQSIFDDMSENAKSLGVRIITLEEELSRLFARGEARESDVKSHSVEIGRLRGELRSVHLIAHIRAKHVLTKKQNELYTRLRHPGGKKQHMPGMHHPESK